jgi:uncharacterized membrane protein YidH (DUF202 family)
MHDKNGCRYFAIQTMDNSNKYLGLLMILLACFIGGIAILVIVFFIFKFTSAALNHLPVFEFLYRYIITISPYLIFLAAYNYIRQKIVTSQHKTSRTIAVLFLLSGILICFASFTLVNLKFFGLQREWLIFFDDNSQYFLILQLFMVFLSAGSLALGDPKEEDWLDKRKREEEN